MKVKNHYWGETAAPDAFDTSGPPLIDWQKGKTVRQHMLDATRVNREASLCNFVPAERSQKLRKASI